ncbi:MAG: hypothetical protein EA370_14440 [Wenzhouxiangella sp.]|nr:MAG: hypothetical protein EA370_14440 [Wenzhouxiangella sp.]
MLPIVKRKTLEIPHGLAAVAAAICMALAFASDFKSREQMLRAEAGESPVVEVMATLPEERSADQKAAAEAARKTRLKPAEGRTLRGLLPLFPLPNQGG